MAVSFTARPKALADLFNNVVVFSKEKNKAFRQVPYVQLAYTWDDQRNTGVLKAVGRGKYTACRQSLDVENGTKEESAEVRVLTINPDKTDIVDDLTKLGSAVRKTSAAKDARVKVTITDLDSILISYADELVGELGEEDPDDTSAGDEEELGLFEEVEEMLDEILESPVAETPLLFLIELIARLKDIKVTDFTGDPAVDMTKNPQSNAVGVAVGPDFRGLIVSVGREGYASGGKWGDGPGDPSHLL